MKNPNDGAFATTQWTRVLAARGDSDEARGALSELCDTYYSPVRTFVRCTTQDASRTDDLTQEFFARMLQRDSLAKLERERGKFRSYLLGAVKHFLADDHKHRNSQRAGGKNEHVEIVEEHASDAPSVMPGIPAPGDTLFDREWALTLLARAMDALQKREISAGRQREFDVLKPWLTGELGDKTQADAAVDLGTSEGAVKVAVHRLRKRFRESLREEIGQTVASPDDVAGELRYLVEVLG